MAFFIIFQLFALVWSAINARPLKSAIKVPFYFNLKDLPIDLQIQVKLNTVINNNFTTIILHIHRRQQPFKLGVS